MDIQCSCRKDVLSYNVCAMKKILIVLCGVLIAISVIKLFIPNDPPSNISEIYNYCKNNGYSTEYCFLTDFSKPSGTKRFYIYSFNEKKIIHKSLCAQGLGVNYNIFKSTFSNEIGSNYSSLGKYKVGNQCLIPDMKKDTICMDSILLIQMHLSEESLFIMET